MPEVAEAIDKHHLGVEQSVRLVGWTKFPQIAQPLRE
jgi:hypothetical protein